MINKRHKYGTLLLFFPQEEREKQGPRNISNDTENPSIIKNRIILKAELAPGFEYYWIMFSFLKKKRKNNKITKVIIFHLIILWLPCLTDTLNYMKHTPYPRPIFLMEILWKYEIVTLNLAYLINIRIIYLTNIWTFWVILFYCTNFY